MIIYSGLNDFAGSSVRKIASAYSDQSGIQMNVVLTNQVFNYMLKFLNGSMAQKQGLKRKKRIWFCFEASTFPFSNKKLFPSCLFETCGSVTIKQFLVYFLTATASSISVSTTNIFS